MALVAQRAIWQIFKCTLSALHLLDSSTIQDIPEIEQFYISIISVGFLRGLKFLFVST